MNTFLRFFYEFISIFFEGLVTVIKGIINGLIQMFNYHNYRKIINSYKGDFEGFEWLFVVIAVGAIVIIAALIGLLIYFSIRRLLQFRKQRLNQEDLLDEIASLNNQVKKLMKEKNEIMAMKVSQLGLKPEEEEGISEETEEGTEEEEFDEADIRFSKLHRIDQEYKDYQVKI